MIIKFTQDHEVNGRLYLAGESRDFDATSAKKLIADGVAVDPEKVKTTVTATNTVGKVPPLDVAAVEAQAGHTKKTAGK